MRHRDRGDWKRVRVVSDESVTKTYGSLFVWITQGNETIDTTYTKLRICCAAHRDWHFEVTLTNAPDDANLRRAALQTCCMAIETLARHSLKSCACASPLELT